jgi:hypothetical protein
MGAGLADSGLFGCGGEGWVPERWPRRMGGYTRDWGSGRRDGGEDFLAEGFEEVVNDPRWCYQSLEHSLPDGSEFALSACALHMIDFELDEVCDGGDHLGNDGLTVEHLEEIGQVGQRAGLWIKRLQAEGCVTGYGLV